MPRRPDSPTLFATSILALLAALAVAGWAGAYAYGAPWTGPGLAVEAALLGCGFWLLVEDPELAPPAYGLLGALIGGGILICLGESLLYPEAPAKENWAPLGFAGLAAGAALLWPREARLPRTLALAAAAGLGVLGLVLAVGHTACNLFSGPEEGQTGSILFWVLVGAALLALAWGAAVRRPDGERAEAPLSRAWELSLLALILAIAACLRFYRPGQLPPGWWFDEVNLARVTRAMVDAPGAPPMYVQDQVENPGAYLWLGAALFKAFGSHIPVLRLASGAFGLLALLPFWALARLWLGPRWALAATLSFGVMHWVLIPQRIAFMSGFALFWMLAAFWALWSAQLRAPSWPRWLLAGLLLGANFHTYTPARLVPAAVLGFLALQASLDRRWRRAPAEWAAFLAGFALLSVPMLWWVLQHWGEYLHRAQEVSIFTDVAKTGHPLLRELWGTFSKHALMFNFRGDFNARHNIHFYPHADFPLACALALGLPWTLGRAAGDARARFLWIWLALMLAAGVFSLPVEAPQGHRTILAAPVLPLAAAFSLRELLARFRGAFKGGWPLGARAAGLALLAGLVLLNAWNLFAVWLPSEATFRSFSPRPSAVAARVLATGPGCAVYVSPLDQEYKFNGYEMNVFAEFVLQQQGRSVYTLSASQAVDPMQRVLHRFSPPLFAGPAAGESPAADGMTPTSGVLLVWGESDLSISARVRSEFPDLQPEKVDQPFPGEGEPACLYEALEVPMQRLPLAPRRGPLPLIYRAVPAGRP